MKKRATPRLPPLKEDSDWVRHVGTRREGCAEVKSHNPDCSQEADSGEGVQASATYALAGGWDQAFLKQL